MLYMTGIEPDHLEYTYIIDKITFLIGMIAAMSYNRNIINIGY